MTDTELKTIILEWEKAAASCDDRNGSICLYDPDSPHRCNIALCHKNNMALKERAEHLSKSDNKSPDVFGNSESTQG